MTTTNESTSAPSATTPIDHPTLCIDTPSNLPDPIDTHDRVYTYRLVPTSVANTVFVYDPSVGLDTSARSSSSPVIWHPHGMVVPAAVSKKPIHTMAKSIATKMLMIAIAKGLPITVRGAQCSICNKDVPVVLTAELMQSWRAQNAYVSEDTKVFGHGTGSTANIVVGCDDPTTKMTKYLLAVMIRNTNYSSVGNFINASTRRIPIIEIDAKTLIDKQEFLLCRPCLLSFTDTTAPFTCGSQQCTDLWAKCRKPETEIFGDRLDRIYKSVFERSMHMKEYANPKRPYEDIFPCRITIGEVMSQFRTDFSLYPPRKVNKVSPLPLPQPTMPLSPLLLSSNVVPPPIASYNSALIPIDLTNSPPPSPHPPPLPVLQISEVSPEMVDSALILCMLKHQ